MSNEPASQDPSTTPSEQPQVEVAATTSAPVESVPSESVQPVSAQPAVEAAQDETANAPRVQLNPTVDPEADRAIPSLAAEPATSVLADLPNEAPLAESIRTGDPVEIPRDAPTLDPELDAAVAAAMGPAGNDTVAPPATGAAPVSSSGATATPAEFNPEEVTPGQRLAGKVVSVYGDSVILDLQGRASAAVPVKNFEANKVPAVGVTLALIAESYDAAEGLIRARVSGGNSVSKPQGDWNAVQVDQVVECLVTKTNKGGLEVTVSNLRGFMPAAQVDVGFCANLEKYVGQKLKAVVLEANAGKKNLILSRRKYLETTQEETRAEAWAKLSVGQRIVGKVKTVKDYGAFIDIGGVDGLLHVSEISWNRLGHPKEVLAEGQEVEVQILGMDADKKKINLGMKQLRTSPWLQVMEKYPIDSVVRGKVTKTTDFGAFVELEPGLEGMIHISELDHKRVVRVTDVVQIGKEVDLKVLTIDPNKRRIALSLKKLIAKPEAPKKPSDEDLAPGANAAPYTPKRDRNNLRGGGTGSGGFSFDRPTRK